MSMKSPAFVLIWVLAGAALAACGARGARADLSAQVASFGDYPIVWLGPSYDVDFDGKPDSITTARTATSPPITNPVTKEVLVPARRSYSISYGTCEIPPGAEGCRIPLTMMFRAPCETRPLSDMVKNGTTRVRGVEAIVETTGYLRFETADFTLTIAAPGATPDEVTQNALRIANDLQPANAKASAVLAAGGDFRPKDAGACAGVTPGDATATPAP